MSRLRRRASARKRESRATVSRVQNPVPRVGLRETPVQRGVRQAVRRLSKGASRFSIRTTRIVRGVRTDGIARTNASRARGTRALPLPTKLNFSIFSIFSSSPVHRDPTRNAVRRAVQVRRGRNDVPHEHGTHVAHPQARGGERRARGPGRREHGHAPHGRGGLGAPPERGDPGLCGEVTEDSSRRESVMRAGGSSQNALDDPGWLCQLAPEHSEPEPGGGASMAAPPRRRPAQGARAAAARGAAGARAFTLAATPTVAIPRFDRHRPNTFCRQMTCSTGRRARAHRAEEVGDGNSTRRASRIRSRTPRGARAAATVGSAALLKPPRGRRPRPSARVRWRFRRSLCTASAATATAGSRWSTRGTCGAPRRFCRTRKRAHDTAVRERFRFRRDDAGACNS